MHSKRYIMPFSMQIFPLINILGWSDPDYLSPDYSLASAGWVGYVPVERVDEIRKLVLSHHPEAEDHGRDPTMPVYP